MKIDWFLVGVRVYLLAGLLTFGYATNADWDTEKPSNVAADALQNVMRGALCGLAWPAYLSFKAFKGVRP